VAFRDPRTDLDLRFLGSPQRGDPYSQNPWPTNAAHAGLPARSRHL